MAQTSHNADRRKQDIHMRLRTLVVTALFLIFGFGVLIYQLYALQLRDAELYRTEAVAQQHHVQFILLTAQHQHAAGFFSFYHIRLLPYRAVAL